MKRTLSIFLSFVILLASLGLNITTATAGDVTFDDGIVASFDTESATLYLTGGEGAEIGNAYDWSLVEGISSATDVKVIRVSAYIDFIGAGVFSDFTNTDSMYVEGSGCGFGDRNSVAPNAELFGFEDSYAMKFAEENSITFHKLYRVVFNCEKTGRGMLTAIFPEGTKAEELKNYNNLFVEIDGVNKHTQYYFIASTVVGSEGLNKDVVLKESSRERDCIFVANPEQTSCELCGKLNPAFSDPEEPSTEPSIEPSTEPSTEPTTQPTTEPVTESTAPATQPTTTTTTTTATASATVKTTQATPTGATKVGSEWIAPKQKNTKVSKLAKAKKSFKATWSKVSGVAGYQVQYATDKNFKKNKKTVTISKNKTTSTTVKKLKAKQKYYVRIRTYKNVKLNGKTVKVYSKWSSVKTVTTK